jgi:membrane peptidoglycan carboxypeptidase
VWLGSPTDNSGVYIHGTGITGANYPAQIWGQYMRAWHAGLPTKDFKEPGPTRAGKFLQLPNGVDKGGGGGATSSTVPGFTIPSVPPGFTVPTFRTPPTFTTSPPSGTDGPGDGPHFPPGFPFDDRAARTTGGVP